MNERVRTLTPSGPFDLAMAARHFGGWPPAPHDPEAIVMAFPVEGTGRSAAVVLRQEATGEIGGRASGDDTDAAWRQAVATLSLDVDGAGWPAVGERDPVIGQRQRDIGMLRPVLFHSPYEAAAGFTIGHRITIVQGRAIRRRIAASFGEAIEVDGERFHAFPTPERLLQHDSLPGVPEAKIARLHAIARAALEGWLQRDALRAMDESEALNKLRTLPGIGEFFAGGVLLRGAGIADALPFDAVTRTAVQRAYGLGAEPSHERMREIAAAWAPYRMWGCVLLHVWVRAAGGLPPRAEHSRRR